MTVKDWRGNDIKVGTRIVYPVAGSTSITLHEAVVEEITQVPHQWRKDETCPVLRVQVGRTAAYGRTEVACRMATIDRVDRVTVIQ